MWGFALFNLVHIPQHGDPSKHRGNSSRQNLSRTLPDIKSKSKLIKPDIWTWATSFAISLFTFSPKIEPTASSPAMIVCREWTWKSLIFLAEIQTCPGVAPFTTSIRPFAPEASPPTVKTTPATFWEDTVQRSSCIPSVLMLRDFFNRENLLYTVVVPYCFDLSGEFFGGSRVDLVEEVLTRWANCTSRVGIYLNCWGGFSKFLPGEPIVPGWVMVPTSIATSTLFICWELSTFLVMAAAPPVIPLARPREAPWGQYCTHGLLIPI